MEMQPLMRDCARLLAAAPGAIWPAQDRVLLCLEPRQWIGLQRLSRSTSQLLLRSNLLRTLCLCHGAHDAATIPLIPDRAKVRKWVEVLDPNPKSRSLYPLFYPSYCDIHGHVSQVAVVDPKSEPLLLGKIRPSQDEECSSSVRIESIYGCIADVELPSRVDCLAVLNRHEFLLLGDQGLQRFNIDESKRLTLNRENFNGCWRTAFFSFEREPEDGVIGQTSLLHVINESRVAFISRLHGRLTLFNVTKWKVENRLETVRSPLLCVTSNRQEQLFVGVAGLISVYDLTTNKFSVDYTIEGMPSNLLTMPSGVLVASHGTLLTIFTSHLKQCEVAPRSIQLGATREGCLCRLDRHRVLSYSDNAYAITDIRTGNFGSWVCQGLGPMRLIQISWFRFLLCKRDAIQDVTIKWGVQQMGKKGKEKK